MTTRLCAVFVLAALSAAAGQDLETARSRQDRAALQSAVRQLQSTAAGQPQDAQAQYRLALAESYLSEITFQLRDKDAAADAAANGIDAANKAVALAPQVAEYHRMLGTLCGQTIPTHLLLAMKYGHCARDSVSRAIELDPRSAKAYVSRGVGNYYLPSAFGGGVDIAIRDFRKAIQLDPASSDAHLWLGIALRKSNRNAEAHTEIAKALALDPNRVWAKQQLEKTPAQ
jgi:tetratricopeptide (TPR) repeat protein